MNNAMADTNRTVRNNPFRTESSKTQNDVDKIVNSGSSHLVGNLFDPSLISGLLDKLNCNGQQCPWEGGEGLKPLNNELTTPSGGLMDIIKPGIEWPGKPLPFPIKPISPPPEVELADPGLTAEHIEENDADDNVVNDIKYEDIDGEIVVGGVNINDVAQGQVGDCYLMAALSSIALHNPEYLENMITDNGNGTYTVSFGGNMGDVVVDDDFAVDAAGNPVYARVGDASNPELWVAIIEKAYTQARPDRDGTFEGIEGGHTYDAIAQITGQTDFTTGAPSGFTPESMQTALSDGQSVTAYTLFADSDKKTRTPDGMVTNHAYVVTDVSMNSNGEWEVTVYNPWGSDKDASTAAETANKVNDGYTVLTMEEFNANFSNVQVLNEPVG